MQSVREPKLGKKHTKEIRHRSVQDMQGNQYTSFTGDGMTYGPGEREELGPEHKRSGNGSASTGFEHKRRKRRRRANGSAPIQHIGCAASGYMIHWTELA